MNKLVASAAFVMVLSLGQTSDASQGSIRRPIDNFLGNWLDHTYSLYNGASWVCLESFGGGCDCAGQADCTWIDYKTYGNTNSTAWAYSTQGQALSCSSWISANWSYGSQGVCHQATANANYYIAGRGLGSASPAVRGLSISNGMFGTWGTSYSGCP